MRKFQIVGKYARPIFWAFLMSGSFFVLIQSFKMIIFSGIGKNFIFIPILMLGVLICFIISAYRVTHPHISDTEYDSGNDSWGFVVLFVLPIVIVLWLIKYYSGLDMFNLF